MSGSSLKYLASICFSEGNRKNEIDHAAQVVARQAGIKLLEVAPNRGRNRTHLFFRVEANKFAAAIENIISALPEVLVLDQLAADVHGLLQSMTIFPANCRQLKTAASFTKKIAGIVAKQFDVPVFLYGNAAMEHRRAFSHYRMLDREKLAANLSQAEWQPDFGPAEAHPTLGCLFFGARLLPVNVEMHFEGDEIGFWENLLQHRDNSVNPVQRSLFEPEIAPDHPKIAEKRPFLENLQTFVDDLPDPKRIRIWCHIADYQKSPLHAVISTFRDIGSLAGMPYLGGRIIGFIPGEILLTGPGSTKAFAAVDDNVLQTMQKTVEDWQLNVIDQFVAKRQVVDSYLVD